MSQPQSQPETTHHDSALEVVAFDSINNFRRALPGTSLPIYRCAALDRASPSDANRLDPLTTIIGTAHSTYRTALSTQTVIIIRSVFLSQLLLVSTATKLLSHLLHLPEQR